jgi:hypothetical protein
MRSCSLDETLLHSASYAEKSLCLLRPKGANWSHAFEDTVGGLRKFHPGVWGEKSAPGAEPGFLEEVNPAL